jgi:plastocyanin
VRRSLARLVPLVVAVVLAGGLGIRWWNATQHAPDLVAMAPADAAPDWDYVIPLGTADRIARGEVVDIVPSELRVEVGQVIRIRNDDTRGQLVGPFYVGAGETMTQRFSAPGRLEGACQIHVGGRLVVEITAA